MKSSKMILFVLAGVWTTLLIIEKIFGAVSSVKAKKSALPIKIVYHASRMFRSALLFCLVIVNVFMAIALIGDSKQAG